MSEPTSNQQDDLSPMLLSVKDAARLLGRSEEMLRRWLRQGIVDGQHIPGRGRPVWAIPVLALADAVPALAVKHRWGQQRSKAEMQRARQLCRRARR